jgi:hypothetical protein
VVVGGDWIYPDLAEADVRYLGMLKLSFGEFLRCCCCLVGCV